VHRQQAYADLPATDLPATDWVSDRVVSLPLWRDLPPAAVTTIVEVLAELGAHAGEVRDAVARGAEEVGACVPS
jgi:dTDP-4-amino-4,6-dideoxygalactose transaminase